MNHKQKKMLARILVTAALLISLHFLPVTGWLRFLCYMVPYLVIGYDILRKAWKGPATESISSIHFLKRQRNACHIIREKKAGIFL